MEITINTQYLAVIGNPVGHSLSPLIHNSVSEKYNQDYVYMPIEISEDELENLIKGFRVMAFKGFNITTPYKHDIMNHIDEISPLAEKIGAVNTVTKENNRLIGHNTDGLGFVKSLEEQLTSEEIENAVFCILGCGGATKSIAMALCETGVSKIFIANRTVSKAEELAQKVNSFYGETASAIPLTTEMLTSIKDEVNVIINTTSVGMGLTSDQSPVEKEVLDSKHMVCDLIYHPRETKLLKMAKETGCKTDNGLNMLIYQGLLAYEIWTGIKPDAEYVKEVLKARDV
jgi:shikimate dehydrogenase